MHDGSHENPGRQLDRPMSLDVMRTVVDEFTLTYPGIKQVVRECFYAVHGADDATRRGYLERAYALGRQF